MTDNDISRQIVDAAYHVHVGLGPGLLEKIYQSVLARELEKRGLKVLTEVPMPVEYEGVRYEMGYTADMVVEDRVIIEIKSVSAVLDVHKKQLLTYLRLSDKRLGLLINFNCYLIKDGITRVVNGTPT